MTRLLPYAAVALLLAGARPAESRGAETLEVTYVTSNARLNVASGGGSLPTGSQSLLRIESPHPSGAAGQARVTLVVAPESERPGWLARRFGAKAAPATPLEVHAADLPVEEAERIVGKLARSGFYLRGKPLNAEVRVGVSQDGDRFAKDFRPVAELDALVLRTRAQSLAAATASPAASLACRRLPPVTGAR